MKRIIFLEAADILGVSGDDLEKLVNDGKLKEVTDDSSDWRELDLDEVLKMESKISKKNFKLFHYEHENGEELDEGLRDRDLYFFLKRGTKILIDAECSLSDFLDIWDTHKPPKGQLIIE